MMADDSPTVDLEQALQTLLAALPKAREKEDDRQTGQILKKIGQIYLERQDAPQALTYFEEALKLASKHQEKESEALLFGFRGLALKLLGNYEMAMQSFQKSYGIASALQRDPLICDALIQMAIMEYDLGRNTPAISRLNQVIEIAEKNSDAVRKLRSYGLIADHYFALDEMDQADKFYASALQIARDLRNSAMECAILTKRGNAALRRGENKTAIKHYETALNTASALEDRSAEINILGGLFRAHVLAGDASLALFYGEQVIRLAREVHFLEAEIVNIHALAGFLIEQKEFAKALAYLEQARQAAEQAQSPDWLITTLTLIAQAHYEAGENQQALDGYTRALREAEVYADLEGQVRLLGLTSAVQADEKQWGEAQQSIQRAIEIAGELQDPGLLGNQYMLLAFNHREQGQVQPAIEACLAAKSAYQSIQAKELLAQAETLLTELSEK
jgi:tetratricopeptide (TPR) repeat protein